MVPALAMELSSLFWREKGACGGGPGRQVAQLLHGARLGARF